MISSFVEYHSNLLKWVNTQRGGVGENRDPRRGGLLISFHSLQDGGTPLHLAALNDQAEATRLLLEAGADPKLKNKVRGILTGWDVLAGPMATHGSFVRLSVGGGEIGCCLSAR